MISTFLVSLALRQDAFQFKFQPKVGEKYRYAVTMTDGDGHPMVTDKEKMSTIYKVAGFKDGKFTVHETTETSVGPKPESHLVGSFRVDSMLNSEMIATDEPTDAGAAGAAMGTKLFGAFGVAFSGSPVKAGDSWKPPFDPKAIAKAFVEGAIPVPNPKIDADGNISVTLDKLDDKVGDFHTVMHMKFDVSVTEGGESHHVTVITDCDQTCSVDRETGIPTKIDRKFTMSMKIDAETNTTALIMHLVRL